MNYNPILSVTEVDEGSFAPLVDRLLYEFAGVDRAFVTAEFAANARRIAREDAALIEDISVDLWSCVEDYEIKGLEAESIIAVNWACVMGVEYDSARIEKTMPCMHRGVRASCSCLMGPMTLSFVGFDRMYITPPPQKDMEAGAILRVATAPKIGRCNYPAEFIARYEEVLIGAVKGRLYGMRNAPWYSRGESQSALTASARDQITVRTDTFVGIGRGSVKLEPRRIL